MRLSDHAKNVYSQSGEDGIVATIFDAIGTDSRRCIEFGAWDGFHLSNTAALWTKGWSGVLIEGVRERYQDLVGNVAGYDCLPLNDFVGTDAEAHLERILQRHGVPLDADLLSIDIDGDDYYVLRSLDRLRPRVIICEYNPTMPYYLDIISPRPNRIGASAAAIARLGDEKGYRAVAMTHSNVFLVRDDLVSPLGGYDLDFDHIAVRDHLLHVISDYDGHYHLVGRTTYGGLGRRSRWSISVPVRSDHCVHRTLRRRLGDLLGRLRRGGRR